MLRPNREKPEFIPFSLAVFSLPCQGNVGIGECVSGIYTWSLTVVGIVAFVQIFYAGWLYLTAAGNIAKTSQAMSKISNAILGIVLLFSSYLILNTINPDLVGNDFNLPNLRGNEVEKVNYENNSNFSPTTIITTTTVLPTDSTTTTRSPDSGTTTTTTRSGGSGNENVGGRGSVSSPCEGMDEQQCRILFGMSDIYSQACSGTDLAGCDKNPNTGEVNVSERGGSRDSYERWREGR